MAKGKMHISADGKARPCEADVRECTLVHGDSAEEARVNYEKSMEAEMRSMASLNKKKRFGGISSMNPAQQAEIQSAVNRGDGWDEYYTATDQKHFQNKDAPGSKFTDPSLSKVEDVVALTMHQRGSLEGDDREKLIARGAKPSAFREGNRYLMVNTPGTLGVKDSREMKDNDLVEVTRTKPGTPVNLVAKVTQQGTTNYGVVVVTKDFDSGEPRVITTFPGTVTFSPKDKKLEALEGKTITVAQAREILGDDFYANTRVVSEEEMQNNKLPAKPHPTYGFDTSRLTEQQTKRVIKGLNERCSQIETHYKAQMIKTRDAKIRRKLLNEMEDAMVAEYQKLRKL